MPHQRQSRIGRRLGRVALGLAIAPVWFSLGGSLVLMTAPVAQAQALRPELRDPFLADPLEDDPRDPLLPNPPIPRPLSPLEQYDLEQDLDRLALEAETLDAEGDTDTAVDLWLREVRLRRLLGLDRELQATQRVAQWLRDRASTPELQLLSARLDVVQQDLDIAFSEDYDRLQLVAATYAVLGDVDAAATIYRTLADQALSQGDQAESQRQLETLAELQAGWFYFEDAAATYGELVQLAQAVPDQEDETRFLIAQSYNLEQAQQWPQALEVQQRLLTLYNNDETQWSFIAPLQARMAQNYRTLGRLETAANSYQAAYINAQESQQFDVAAGAIRELADIYKTLERWADVRYLYEQLIVVEQQAFNAYGLMEAFDQLGQVNERTGDPQTALLAYREGLVLARLLNHRQSYFTEQIARLSGEPAPADPPPNPS